MPSRPALKAARKRKGFTQSELADEIGVKQSTISRVEKGEIAPTEAVRRALESVLGVRLDDDARGSVPARAPGEGAQPVDAMPSDPYPTRAPVLAMARALGVHRAAIEAVLALAPASDPGEEWWEGRLLHYAERARVMSRAAAPPSDPPPSSVPPPSAASTGIRRRV